MLLVGQFCYLPLLPSALAFYYWWFMSDHSFLLALSCYVALYLWRGSSLRIMFITLGAFDCKTLDERERNAVYEAYECLRAALGISLEIDSNNQHKLPICWLYAGSYALYETARWKYDVSFDRQSIIDKTLEPYIGGGCVELFCARLNGRELRNDDNTKVYKIEVSAERLFPYEARRLRKHSKEGLYVSFKYGNGSHAVTAQQFMKSNNQWYCDNWHTDKKSINVEHDTINYIARLKVKLWEIHDGKLLEVPVQRSLEKQAWSPRRAFQQKWTSLLQQLV